MSHIVTIKTEVRCADSVRAACDRLRLPAPVVGTHPLYERTVQGLGVNLEGWRYPAVCDLESGQVHYDNFGGRWGDDSRLGGFLQAYAVEKAKLEARKAGHTAVESVQADGSILVTVEGV